MNPKSNPLLPGAGRSRKRFSTWLSWLVISAQILALVTTATVGAIQPTPQVAQEAARSLELPPWLSNSLAGLAWGVQQLLGAPQSAQAALPAPGGVDANLRLWVKASAGTNTTTPGANVTTWADQSGNGANMAVTVAGREPTYQAAAAATNYNPALLFADPNDGMELAPFMTGTEAGGSVFGAAANNTPGTGFDNLVDFGIDNPHLGTAAGTGAPLGYMNGSSPIRNDHPTVPIASQFHLWSWEWTMAAEPSNTLSNTGLDVIFNGEVFSEPTMEVRASSFAEGAPSANEFQIGSYEAVEVWDGPIGEVVVYDRNLTAVESQRVSSYLAIKYGTTLDSDDASTTANYDYLASDGTSIIWPGTSNATYQPYHNNVAGIGRDDNSALDQRKSHSVNAGFQPVLDNGAAFTTDKSFLVWGNDTGAATFAITYAPTSFTPPAGYFRMARVWKVQETGTVGNVAVQGTGADHLLVSSDPTFASGVTEIDMSSGSATVNFTNGQYFTFGALLTAPGGVVSGLQAWYDAASGVTLSGSNVSGWDDRTTNGHDTTQATASRQPLFEDGTLGINFNPSIHFQPIGTATEDMLSITGVAASGNRVFQDADDGTVVAVGDNRDNASPHSTLIGWGTDANNPQLATYSGVMQIWNNGSSPVWTPGSSNAAAAQKVVNNQPYLYGWQWLNAAGGVDRGVDTRLNGNGVHYPDMEGANIQNFVNNDQHIGWNNCCSEDWTGRISEIAVYDQKLSGPDLQRVDSYFAIKYGITISPTVDSDPTVEDGDYVDSGSAVIWDYSANTTYQNNIAGIGRDDASALNQKQAKSANSGFQPVVGLTSIAATNAANANTFAADKNFMLWGSNTGSASFGITYAPTSFTPPAGYFRIARVWKVQETGTVGNVAVQATNADHLLVSSDPTFASGVTEIDMSSGSATVNFTNGQYFTFGALLTAPGGVVSGLQAWYDAASGVTLSGSNVSGWNDRTANGHNTTQATASRQPLFEDGTLGINFNPAIHFLPPGTATEDMLSITGVAASSNRVFQDTDDGSVVAVGDNRDNASPHSTLIGWGTDANNPQLATYSGVMQIWNNGSSPVWTPGSSNAAAAQKVVDNQAYLYGWQWLNAAGGVDRGVDTRLNGNGVHYPDMEGANIQNFVNNDQHIGWNNCCSEDWTGRISEIAVYDQKLNGPDLQRVDSYFAIKYGITISPTVDSDPTVEDGDYVDSSSAVIWDYSVNTTYHHNIAGIGRDDASALNQKQAKSVNSGFQPIIGLTSIAATNAANANTFAADKNFMVWGSNNSAASYGTAYTPTSFTPAAGYFRMNRVWKVQETGTVGNVAVQGTGADHLLVSSDPTFATGVTEIALSSGSATVNFSNGQFFTFGRELTAPGGVAANLAAWYKADGTISATQWDDESSNGKHMLAAGDGTAARMPTVEAAPGAINNFNPRVAFLSNADANRKWTMTASGNNVFANTTTPGTIFNVSSFPDETVYDVPQLYAFEDDDPGLNLVTDRNAANDIRVIFQRDNSGTGSAGWDFAVPGFAQTQPLLTAHAWNYAAGGNTFSFDGYDYTPSSNPFIGATSPRYMFGSELTVAAGEAHSGYTSENIVYSTNWPSNSSERKRINSYLAIKYGVTLLGTGTLAGGAADATFGGQADYLDSASTTIWNGTTTNSTYHNNVAGIGRDDASALNQKQSTSISSGFQPVIGLGIIAASNAANSNTFAADKNFMLWGSNTSSASFGTAYPNIGGLPASRMARVWKVAETGTVGNVVVQSVSGTHLLVSSDPTFASGVTEIALSGGSATVDFTNGQYFTFAAALTAPGGVANGLAHWVRADAGVYSVADTTLAGAGASVKQWQDQSTQALHVTPNAAANEPIFQTGGATTNFNPYLDFTNDYLINASRVVQTTDGLTMISVGTTRVLSGVRTMYSLGTNGNEPTVDLESNFISPYYSFSSPSNVDIFTGGQVPTDMPMIWGSRAANNVADDFKFSFQGEEVATTLEIVPNAAYGNKVHVGTGVDSVWDGLIMEGLTYNRKLTSAEAQKVNSYLALKYGITLRIVDNDATIVEGDYIATDGSKVWDKTANSTYHNNVAGIGRDDAEALNQKQSKSVNTGTQVVMGLGSIAASNAANGNTFAANKNYEVWGNNTGAATLTSNYNGGTNNRITRVWKVQESGTVGTVKVQIPTSVAAGLQSILVHTVNTFATVDRSYALTIVGSNYEADVNFNNNDFFTFSTNPAVAPLPDLTTTIGQPSPNFVAGSPSNVPMTVTNSGAGPTIGPINMTMTLPANTSAPASFSSGGNTCTTIGQTVTCVNPGPIAAGGSNVIQVPVTPSAATVGTQPVFNGTVSAPGETNTGNNPASPMTPTTPVIAVCPANGTFGAQVQTQSIPFSVGWNYQKATLLGDVNGDGKRDVVMVYESSGIYVSLGNGDSTFGPQTQMQGAPIYGGSTGSESTLLGDVNGDGKLDLVFVLENDGVYVGTGNGNGTFNSFVKTTTTPAMNVGTTSVEYTLLGDVTSDGKLDLVFVDENAGVFVNTGNGDGTFSTTQTQTQGSPGNVGATFDEATLLDDVTGDGKLDLVFVAENNGVYVGTGNGNGTFNTQTKTTTLPSFNVGETVSGEATLLGDVNSDGIADIVFVVENVGVFVNTGNSTCTPPDLTTTIGKPSPAFVAGVASNVPMTVTNNGGSPTTGTVTASMTLPANTSAPASFTSGVWSCTTSGQTVTCTQPGPIAAGGSNVIQVPVTPNVSTVGTQPGPFTGSASTPGESNSGNNAASPMTPTVPVAAAGLTLPVKVLLQGAYNAGSGLMNDNLRSLPSFPLTSPYGDGAVIASSSVLTANNIVDWVLVELRGTGALSTTVVARQGALLQRDGDVVGVDGVSTLSFSGLAGSSYYVVVKHRNHLGIMTANPVALSASTPLLDFTNPATPVYIRTRTVAQKSQSGKMLLWGGDANGDGDVKGAGPGTDPGAVRLAVLSHPGNTSFVANYVAAGYAKADVTMNGQTIGAGPGNEVSNLILPNVLTHPGNPTAQNNYIICQQLPEDPCN